MSNQKLDFQRFLDIVGKRLGINPAQIREDANLTQDLGADSLAMLKIVNDVEDWLGAEVGDLDFEGIQTVKDAYTALGGA